MDVMVFSILLLVALFWMFLAYHIDAPADLFVPAVILLLLAVSLFQSDLTENHVISTFNSTTNTTVTQTITTTLEMPYRRIIALLFMFVSCLLFINATKDVW